MTIQQLVSLVMALALVLLAATPAYANSFFPTIPTKSPTAQAEYAPSYAVCMGVSPMAEKHNTVDNCLWVTYNDVTEENFQQFGSYLQEKGYSLTDSRFEDATLIATVEKGEIHFEVEYNRELLKLTTKYPDGVTPEPQSTVTGTMTPPAEKPSSSKPERERAAARKTISAGGSHYVMLNPDGTVKAKGSNSQHECDVSSWRDIVAVSGGSYHTVGLKSDGTVVATGLRDNGRCDVSDWSRIIAIDAGRDHTVGLTADGRVAAVGDNGWGQCDVHTWTDMIAVSAGSNYTIGLKPDGTVVAAGGTPPDFVESWTDIVAICAGYSHAVGLKSDGTVVAAKVNSDGQCNVGGWTNIIAISAGNTHTVGLRADGTVVATGDNKVGQCNVNGWSDIIAISAEHNLTVGLRADGTVVTAGYLGG